MLADSERGEQAWEQGRGERRVREHRAGAAHPPAAGGPAGGWERAGAQDRVGDGAVPAGPGGAARSAGAVLHGVRAGGEPRAGLVFGQRGRRPGAACRGGRRVASAHAGRALVRDALCADAARGAAGAAASAGDGGDRLPARGARGQDGPRAVGRQGAQGARRARHCARRDVEGRGGARVRADAQVLREGGGAARGRRRGGRGSVARCRRRAEGWVVSGGAARGQ
eukprot:898331-Rhodomonas_salina.2